MARRGDGIFLRGKTWWLDFQHRGTRHAVRLGRNISKSVARELATVQRGAILKGEAGIGPKPKPKDPTFEDAKAEFLKWIEANRKTGTLRGYRGFLKRLGGSFAGRRLSDIDPLSIERYKHARLNAGARIAANRELAILKSMFNRCRGLGLYEGTTPEIKLTREPKTRFRILDADEEARLLAAASEPVRTIIIVGLHTGLRIAAEALTLRKEDVDLNRGGLLTVQAAYAKNGKMRAVPLNRAVRAALAGMIERTPGPYVFAKPDGAPYRSIRSAFEAACEEAKLRGVTPHTLRHTFASRLAMAGVDPRTIQDLGGWSSLEMVQRYTHLSPSHRVEAVERLAENFTTGFTTPALRPSSERRASAV